MKTGFASLIRFLFINSLIVFKYIFILLLYFLGKVIV